MIDRTFYVREHCRVYVHIYIPVAKIAPFVAHDDATSGDITLRNSRCRPQVHSFYASGDVFTLERKYKLIKPIGTGAYGAVISATNQLNGESVAVKKIAHIFDDLVDAKVCRRSCVQCIDLSIVSSRFDLYSIWHGCLRDWNIYIYD